MCITGFIQSNVLHYHQIYRVIKSANVRNEFQILTNFHAHLSYDDFFFVVVFIFGQPRPIFSSLICYLSLSLSPVSLFPCFFFCLTLSLFLSLPLSLSLSTSLSLSLSFSHLFTAGKRRYNIKLWKTFTDCFNCLPVAAIVDEKIFCMHGGLSPELQNMEQIKRIMRPTGMFDVKEEKKRRDCHNTTSNIHIVKNQIFLTEKFITLFYHWYGTQSSNIRFISMTSSN